MGACELCGQPSNTLSGKVIALDVGHGWNQSDIYDAGAVGNGTTEQVLNAKVANRAAELLRSMGAVVHVFDYARAGSARLWLSEKGKRAGAIKADVFISIHHNAFNGSAQGTETLVHTQATSEDVKLAKIIHSKLIEQVKLADRGVKWQKLGVLGGCPASIPACLTEAFFVDSVRFKGSIPELIIEAEALAIALGIKEFLVGV
jgi:N-acetylmuramoyl-L-alanine amidase